MENNNGGNKFLNGFLLGALIGAGAVFLLSSKKGKQLLKTLSEEGLDDISNFLREEDMIEEDFGQDGATSVKDSQENQKQQNGRSENNPIQAEKKPFVKRFFRGISKRH